MNREFKIGDVVRATDNQGVVYRGIIVSFRYYGYDRIGINIKGEIVDGDGGGIFIKSNLEELETHFDKKVVHLDKQYYREKRLNKILR